MNEKYELNDRELEKVIGGLGISNPVSKLTKEEAQKIAEELGEGRDMGSWSTMSGAEFMKWWEGCHEKAAAGDDVGGICG